MKIEEIYECFLQCSSVTTDTRNIHPNSLFVALKGENFDANTFAEEAIIKGALFVIIDDKKYYTDKSKMILVNNCLETLQALATFHRQELGLSIIALTGSNGKTTTKELIHVVLSKKYQTIATIGNLNNHIGVPLTLLRLKKDTDIGIIEMGANHQKEIELLSNITQPDFGYITNFGKAHLEGFGGVEGVIKGKSELYSHLELHKKLSFVNLDDAIQKEKTAHLSRFTFSINDKSNVQIKSVTAHPFVKINYDNVEIQSNLIGVYNATNLAAAITIGKYFNIEDQDIKMAIENYFPTNNRSQLIEQNGNHIILDAYNANPSSMKVALENFIELYAASKTIFLGDMFELGDSSPEEHKDIIDSLINSKNITCYFIGKYFYENKVEHDNFFFFKTFEEMVSRINVQDFNNQYVLIKGSRGMQLERVLPLLSSNT